MKKKGKKNLYSDAREEEEEILREEYFLDDNIENDDEYWLDDEEEIIDDTEEYSEAADEDYWLDEDEEYLDDETDESEYEEESDDEYSEYEESEDEEDSEEGEEYEDDSEDDEYFEEVDDDSEEYDEEDDLIVAAEKAAKRKKMKKKILKGLGITVGVIAAVYVGISVFFMSHFYYNTTINGKDFSFKNTASVEEYMKSQVEGYTLTIKEKNNIQETIAGTDIDLVYVESDEIKKALDGQNAFLWPQAFFGASSSDVTVQVSYDKTKLNKLVNSLQALKVEQTEPVDAYPAFDGEQFSIAPEVYGTAVDKTVLNEKVNQYITGFIAELDMEADNCYKKPKYTIESEELQKACDEMNKYLTASITYKMKEDVVVDKTVINEWVTVDDKLAVTFDEEKVKTWLTWFGDTYDTVGVVRTITNPLGEAVEVSGGDYGWSIDEETEFTALVASIKAGEVIEKEPAYYQTAAAHSAQDWGSTYVEVDISRQHMWLIQNGVVTLETDIVTGTPTPARETTKGVFAMKEKMYGKVLTGAIDPATGEPEYRTPVSYWMRVTWSGIGFHDATWQAAFGGTRYQNGYGSHGCINMPYNSAAALIELVYTGMPVIIHE